MKGRKFYHCIAVPYEALQILLMAPIVPAIIVLAIGGFYSMTACEAWFFSLIFGGIISFVAILRTAKLPEFDAEFFEGGDDNGYNN